MSAGGMAGALLVGMIEGLFGSENYQVAKKMLDAAHLRQRALAANLANVNTPGYQRVDVSADFEAKLNAAARTGDMRQVNNMQPSLSLDLTATSTRADGNNVSLDGELLEINKNAMAYEYLSGRVGGSIKQLKVAITGNPSMG